MEFLLKASALTAIFFTIYKIFIERDTFFESNRWFLLLGLLLAMLLPLIIIPVYIEYQMNPAIDYIINDNTEALQQEHPFNILDYIPYIYGMGVLYFSIRFIIQLVSLTKFIIKNKRFKENGFTFIETDENISPFSFFKWIVYNPTHFNKNELQQIIIHEKVHAKEYHSIDNFIAQLSCIILWFNPFVWLYTKELKENLEFIADKKAIKNQNCKKEYQYTLLKTSLPSHQMVLSNSFYNSSIKKRIVMLQKSKSRKINQLKYALIIPVIAGFLMSFNTKEVYILKEQSKDLYNLKSNTEKDIEIIFNKDLTNKALEKLKKTLKNEGVTFSYSNLNRNEKNEIVSINATFKDEKGSATWNASNSNNEPIQSFYFFKKADSFGVRALNDVIEDSEDFEDSEAPNKHETEKIIFRKIQTDTLHFDEKLKDSIHFSYQIEDETEGKTNVVFRQGNRIISSDSIIFTKSNKSQVKSSTNKDKNPLFVINGTISKKETLDNLNPDEIESITVLKDISATSIYGNKGKNGVILIVTKNEASINKNKKLERITVKTIKHEDTKKTIVKTEIETNDNTDPLFILNNKEISKEKMEAIDPKKIESVNVLKGPTAIEKYGEKGKNGVVEITSK